MHYWNALMEWLDTSYVPVGFVLTLGTVYFAYNLWREVMDTMRQPPQPRD